MSQKITCTSCKKEITNDKGTVEFNCPSCLKQKIVRCKHCREIAAKFNCPVCGFEGPN